MNYLFLVVRFVLRFIAIKLVVLTLKRLRGAGEHQFDTPPSLWFFQRCVFWRQSEALFFVSFIINNFCEYYHKSRLSWKFHLNSSSRSVDMKIFSIDINGFHQFFRFFWHFLVTKKLMASAYNRWCQYFFLLSSYSK